MSRKICMYCNIIYITSLGGATSLTMLPELLTTYNICFAEKLTLWQFIAFQQIHGRFPSVLEKHNSQVIVRLNMFVFRVSFSVLGDLQTYSFLEKRISPVARKHVWRPVGFLK